MRTDRRGLKWSARDAMRAASPNAMLMTLLYLMLTAGLSLVVGQLVADPLLRMFDLYQQGVALERAIPLAVTGVGSVTLFLNILLIVFSVVVRFGYKGWCLNTARGERGSMSDLTGGFSMVGRILWLYIRIAVYCLLWYVAIIFPAFWCMLLLSAFLGPIWGGAVALFGAEVVFFSRVLRYAMAPYCLLDEPEMGATEAMRRSCWMMTGRVGEYVLLRLSFFGWFLLNMFIVSAAEGLLIAVMGGVHLLAGADMEALELMGSSVVMSVVLALVSWPLELWLKPYVTTTECKFYDQIKVGPADRPPF